MVFGADDYEVFLSHASEDKAEIARPIFEACTKAGIKAFLDEDHIGWGENFTKKINTALGAARTVLVIVSSNSVSKDWPLAEINTALAFEVEHKKRVVALVVGNPDLSKLPLIKAKNYLTWTGDPTPVVAALKRTVQPEPEIEEDEPDPSQPRAAVATSRPAKASPWGIAPPPPLEPPKPKRRGFFAWLLGRE